RAPCPSGRGRAGSEASVAHRRHLSRRIRAVEDRCHRKAVGRTPFLVIGPSTRRCRLVHRSPVAGRIPGDLPVLVVTDGLTPYLRSADGVAMMRRITRHSPGVIWFLTATGG